MAGAGRLLTKEEILSLLTTMGEVLAAQNRVGRIHVVGGAAIALGYNSNRLTEDVDAVMLTERELILAASEVAAKRLGVKPTWLDRNVFGFVTKHDDRKSRVVFQHPGLQVVAGSPEELLAMKLLAGRRKDRQDVELLIRLSEHPTPEKALEMMRTYFPKCYLTRRSSETFRDHFGAGLQFEPTSRPDRCAPYLKGSGPGREKRRLRFRRRR